MRGRPIPIDAFVGRRSIIGYLVKNKRDLFIGYIIRVDQYRNPFIIFHKNLLSTFIDFIIT